MLHPTLVALSATVLLTACSTIKPVGVPNHPWQGDATLCAATSCTQKEAVRVLATANSFCTDLREFYERGGQVSSGQRLFVGILGSLAGSVFAVTAAGSASKAWAGLSGATNGIQTQIDQATLKPKDAVIGNIAAAQIAFADRVKPLLTIAQPDWNQVVGEAVLLPNVCSGQAGLGLAKAAADAEKVAQAAQSAEAAASDAQSAASAAASSAAAAAKRR